jgi:hypothetical protein
MSYTVNIDNFDRPYWDKMAKEFADYSIHQTWPYQQNKAGVSKCQISRAVVTNENNQVCLMCQVRIKNIKCIGLKIGYIQWGPLVRGNDDEIKCCVTALIELRKAYLGSVVNVLRVVPNMPMGQSSEIFSRMLKAAGFTNSRMFSASKRVGDLKKRVGRHEICHLGVFDACSNMMLKVMWILSEKLISVVKS